MLEFLFDQYATYPTHEIVLEIVAIIFGLMSVWFAKKDKIWVFPSGIINTTIYVYLLWKWSLLGDMMLNFYYIIMSIYGWHLWTRKKGGQVAFPISKTTTAEKNGRSLFFC